MASAAREGHAIHLPVVSLIGAADRPPADPPATSSHTARVAAFVLVPLSIALVALRLSGTLP